MCKKCFTWLYIYIFFSVKLIFFESGKSSDKGPIDPPHILSYTKNRGDSSREKGEVGKKDVITISCFDIRPQKDGKSLIMPACSTVFLTKVYKCSVGEELQFLWNSEFHCTLLFFGPCLGPNRQTQHLHTVYFISNLKKYPSLKCIFF